MAVLTGPMYVAPPNAVVPRYGLFKVATGPLDLPAHATTGGLEYEIGSCEPPIGYEIACADPATKTFGGGPDLINADPFVVMASFVCGTIGMDAQRAERIVRERLYAGEQARVERIFSQGTFGQSPSLANNPAAVQLTAASGLEQAVATLETWLYVTMEYGPLGVLHVPAGYAAILEAANVMRWNDSKGIWQTALGTPISFGNYLGLAADGTEPDANHTNIYITGPVAVYRTPDSSVFVSPYGSSINTTTNQLSMFAEREYVVTFDCHVAAVDVFA